MFVLAPVANGLFLRSEMYGLITQRKTVSCASSHIVSWTIVDVKYYYEFFDRNDIHEVCSSHPFHFVSKAANNDNAEQVLKLNNFQRQITIDRWKISPDSDIPILYVREKGGGQD